MIVGAAPMYGKVVVKLRSEAVKDRTTIVFGDSFRHHPLLRGGFTWEDGKKLQRATDAVGDVLMTGNEYLASYHEAQVHGGLDLADIEEVAMPDSEYDRIQPSLWGDLGLEDRLIVYEDEEWDEFALPIIGRYKRYNNPK